jgi:ATP-dependent DNA helicase RecG
LPKPRSAAAAAARQGGRDIAARLDAIGLRTDWDFVLHLPLRYEDETVVMPIDQLQEGLEAQVEAVVTAAGIVFRGRRQLRVTVQDEHRARWFSFLHFTPRRRSSWQSASACAPSSVARGGLAGMEMIHPRVRTVRQDEPLPRR